MNEDEREKGTNMREGSILGWIHVVGAEEGSENGSENHLKAQVWALCNSYTNSISLIWNSWGTEFFECLNILMDIIVMECSVWWLARAWQVNWQRTSGKQSFCSLFFIPPLAPLKLIGCVKPAPEALKCTPLLLPATPFYKFWNGSIGSALGPCSLPVVLLYAS